MVNFRLCLFTISFITLTFTLQPFHVLSDAAMIINVCDKTPDPSLCKTCLNSDPKSKTADVRGLAMISITCGTRDADKLYNDTDPKSATADVKGLATISITCGTRDADELYTDTDNLYTNTKDPALHNLLDNCWWRFLGARDNIDSAGRMLSDKGSDAAKLAITRYAMPMITCCSDLSKKSPTVAVPKNIIDEMNVVSNDCQIILEILSNF
ncbi:hypothetical protein GOBAR_AA30668 [Gossypium barbadense]|uniref:Uncharacterized protein n=1 Tax=Gossypium barbadense TaxID=3634 RepID=A0A2P5WG03_GOSBA|nr:hypothetical protein GOBAR_AA30668 [Gossypium barbadense]